MNIDQQIAPSTDDYQALTQDVGFVARPAPALLALIGDDAAEFLQGQVTNDIEELTAGQGHYAALLTPKGKLRADMRVLKTDDELLVLTDTERLPIISHTINTFRIGYFFKAEDRGDDVALISLIGPKAHERLNEIAPSDLGKEENANAPIPFGDSNTRGISTLLGVDLLGTKKAIAAATEELTAAGVKEASAAAAEIVRVEHAIPSFGHELDENIIPGEAGLNERAVSFEKGCYVGQETVARMHYKGKPNRSLKGLRSEQPLTKGATVTAQDGKELGTVGTAVVSPEHGPIALVVLRREGEPGDKVDVSGVNAEVVDVQTFFGN
jgi:folate-binding protein YgfZ